MPVEKMHTGRCPAPARRKAAGWRRSSAGISGCSATRQYVTDIMPVAHAEFSEKFAGRYFSTPKKMGAQTAEANINAGIAAARQIVGFLKDGCEKFRVNK